MKNKFWKITSVIMTAASLAMVLNCFVNGMWWMSAAWSGATAIWVWNIKLWWND